MATKVTFSSLKQGELFIISNHNEDARIMVKVADTKAQYIRGPDHHGRIIYDIADIPSVTAGQIVQRISRSSVADFMS